jgi:hypothetical protein
VIEKRIERKLRCELTESDLLTRAASLADNGMTIDETNAARSKSSKEFKDLLAGLEERRRELSLAIRTGFEERLVPCVVRFHHPVEATKTIIRLDTGELVEECAMSAEECQTRMFAESAAAPVVIENPSPAELEEFATDGTNAIAPTARDKELIEDLGRQVSEAIAEVGAKLDAEAAD